MARILALSSHVVRGSVGLAATVPALQSLGHEVWALPTITLASRPGLGNAAMLAGGRRATPAAELAGMLDALEQDGCWPLLDAVFTGYFPSADTVAVAADAIASIRAINPRVQVLVDPIIGDAGRLYVAEATAAAIRDRLMPLADVSTPNRFELEWLTDMPKAGLQIEDAAARLGPAMVVVTSAHETEREIATLLLTPTGATERTSTTITSIPNGTGDLLDGLLLGHLLHGCTSLDALDASLATLARVLAASAGKDVLDLSALAPKAH